jgi:nucleotide-binding universal stress UspA family protein
MNILVALDDSQCSQAATELLTAQVRTEGTHVRLLHVVEPFPVALAEAAGAWRYSDVLLAKSEEHTRAEELLEQAAHKLRTVGFVVTSAVEDGDVRSVILDDAQRWHADLIVVGSHGRKGLARFLMGSVSDAVAHHAPCSVEIVRIHA